MRYQKFAGLGIALFLLSTLAMDPPGGAAQAAAGGPAKPAASAITPWTPDDILLAERSSQWEIAPDGRSAVWAKSQMDKEKNGGISNLFLTDLETKTEIQLTRGTDNNSRPRWSPDGAWIAF